jgi:beta-fructofuranosidase
MLTRRTILQSLALTTGAALTRKLPALESSDAAIATLSRDPMRPQYHLLPRHGWMNDPCGPIFWKGRYHMFLQYNDEPVSGVKLWAHATSPDMVRWHRQPVALAPTPGGPDADGCWTGTAAVVDGKPTFLYTGVVNSTPDQATLADANPPLRESVCMAVAEDDALLHWRKQPQPVIPAPPAGMKVTGFRDPSPWRQAGPGQGNQDHWYLIVASGERGAGGSERSGGGEVLLYRSADFRHWEYLHPMAQGKPNGKQGTDPVDSGEMWECPDFFPLDGKHVLIHSTERRTLWQIGTLDPATMLFHAENEGLLDHGAYYAPKSQLDAHGNRILWGWITETRPEAEYRAAGWSGMMSLPRRLSISNGQLVMEPAPEIASLRTGARSGTAVKRLPSAAQEIRLALEPSSEPLFDQSFVDHQGAALLLRSSLQQSPNIVRIGDAEITLTNDLPLDLHIFLDHSVAEIFINYRHAVTRRYYARTPMEPAVAITLGGNWRITQQQAWSLKSIW